MGKKYSQAKLSKGKSKKNTVIAIVIAAITAGIIIAYFTNSNNDGTTADNKDLLLGSWMDVHGVGVFLSGSDESLYLATHNGLFKKGSGKGWALVCSDTSDLMGFTISQAREGVMYSSGHPTAMNGNLGFRKSVDGGVTWQTISYVKDQPVDFHAMTASAADGNIIYGSPGGGTELFVTDDEGRTWSTTSIPDRIISLAAHPSDKNTVFAGTVSGLFSSNDQGRNWKLVDDNSVTGAVTAVGFMDVNTVYTFVIPEQGDGYIVKSPDGGITWIK
ncbi:MAG: WD40/YVTN/BNR-like repeat-containing protein, partial [Nitrososphaerota archaeon]